MRVGEGMSGGDQTLKSGEGVFAPIEDKQEAEEHTAKVGKMRNAVGTEEAFQQLKGGISNNEPLGFDGHKAIEVDALVGEHHAKGQQDSEHGTRCANGKEPARNKNIAKSGTYAADDVIEQESA